MCDRSLGGNLEKKQADEWLHAFSFLLSKMKKILFLLVLLSTNILLAQENNDSWQKEHKGLDIKVRGGYSSGLGDAKGFDMINIEASVGKRFDNMFFGLGSGAWIGTSSGSDAIIPITLDWESFFTKGRITPTTLLRTGFAVNTASDIKVGKETIKMPNFLIIQAMPGVRLGISRCIDLDLGVGLTGMTSIGGSEGTSGTNVYLSFGGALNFHKSTKSKVKPKVPTRERGMQVTVEGNWLGFAGGNLDYEGEGLALAVSYKLNHKLSAGIGMGGYGTVSKNEMYGTDVERITKFFLRGQYNLTSKRFSPFIACDAGMHMYSYYDYISKPKSTGFYVDPSIGLSIRTTNNSYLDLKVGYSLTTVDVTDDDMYFTESENSVSGSAPFISLGFRHTFGWGSKWFK